MSVLLRRSSLLKFCKASHSLQSSSRFDSVRFNGYASLANAPQHDDPTLWVQSPHPKIPPLENLTLNEWVWSALGTGKNRHEKICFECGVTGRKYTFGDVYKYSKAFGASLMNAKYRKGDTIAIALPNIPEYVIALFGAWEAGLKVTSVNPGYTADELRKQLGDSESKGIVSIPQILPTIREAQKGLPNLKDIILVGETHAGCHNFGEMIKTSTTGVQFFNGRSIDVRNEIAFLPYSSGTTGPPKGVMLTHHNILNCVYLYNQPGICAFRQYDDENDPERTIGLLPFFHVYGFWCFMALGMYHGANCLTLPRFEPNSFVKAMRQHKPTALHLVTPLISFIVNSPEIGKKELENLHAIVAGAAPIGKTLATRFLEKADKYVFFQEGYGMTELSPVSHVMYPEYKNTKLGSCGFPTHNITTKIVDPDTGKTIGRNQPGELCVKGPQVMQGYFKNAEATKNTIDADDWLHTGDIAYHDEEGLCYIVDRVKELIKVKGFQVAPSELEDILRKHPKVTDVAVIGVPDEEAGELPRAYIVRSDEQLEAKEINSYLDGKLSPYKQLKGGIEFVTVIPKAASGKILRRELLKGYRAERGITV